MWACLICFLKGQSSISSGITEACLQSESLFAKFHLGAISQNEFRTVALSLAVILWLVQGFTFRDLAVP